MPESNQESELVPEVNSDQKSGPEAEPRPEGAENRPSPETPPKSVIEPFLRDIAGFPIPLRDVITGSAFEVPPNIDDSSIQEDLSGMLLALETTVDLLRKSENINDPGQQQAIRQAITHVLSVMYEYILRFGQEVISQFPEINRREKFKFPPLHKFFKQTKGEALMKSNN